MLFSIPKAERKLIFITNEELNNPVRTRSHEKTTEAGRNFTSSSQQEAGRKAAVESIIRRQQAHTTGGVLESADALSPRTAQRPIRTREQSMAVSAPASTAQQEAARKAAVQNLVRRGRPESRIRCKYPIGKVFYTPEDGNAHLLRLGPTGRSAGPCWDCGEGGEWDGGKLTIPAPAIC
jgi:hypothetical protein